MEKSNFDRLLQRYLTGQVSEEERIKIEAWLEVMKTEDNADLELSKEDEESLFQKISNKMDNVKEIVDIRPVKEKKLTINTWLIRIAATLLIVSIASYAIWYVKNITPERLEVASANGIEKVILKDGSLVWLRGKSKLVYYEKQDGETGYRYSELEGEALFEVTRDASRPFIIKCGEVNIKVLGTSFSLKKNNGHVELNVLTGNVNISSVTNSIDVAPNEKAIYKGNGEFEKLTFESNEVAVITANTEYNMLFANVIMEDVLKSLEKKFDVNFRLDNKDISKCRITADFTDHSLENSLQMITEVLDVEYARDGNVITLSGSGCK